MNKIRDEILRLAVPGEIYFGQMDLPAVEVPAKGTLVTRITRVLNWLRGKWSALINKRRLPAVKKDNGYSLSQIVLAGVILVGSSVAVALLFTGASKKNPVQSLPPANFTAEVIPPPSENVPEPLFPNNAIGAPVYQTPQSQSLPLGPLPLSPIPFTEKPLAKMPEGVPAPASIIEKTVKTDSKEKSESVFVFNEKAESLNKEKEKPKEVGAIPKPADNNLEVQTVHFGRASGFIAFNGNSIVVSQEGKLSELRVGQQYQGETIREIKPAENTVITDKRIVKLKD